MFTWICPKCGTEVPPSYNDCPNCAAREKAAAAVPAPAPVYAPPPPVQQAPVYAAPPPPVQQAPVYAAPPPPLQQAPSPAPVYAQPPLMGTAPTEPPAPPTFSYGGAPASASYEVAPPAPASGVPSWLIAVLSIVGVAAVGYGVIHFMTGKSGAAAETATEETAKVTGTSPLGKYVEVVGFRIVEDKQKVQLKFVIVNHSAGEIAPFDLLLEVHTKNQKPGDAPLFTIKTPVSGVAPFEAKDMTIPAKTSMRAYEIPDWQFLTATFDIVQK